MIYNHPFRVASKLSYAVNLEFLPMEPDVDSREGKSAMCDLNFETSLESVQLFLMFENIIRKLYKYINLIVKQLQSVSRNIFRDRDFFNSHFFDEFKM